MKIPDWKLRREIAEQIWRAGVDAVNSKKLVQQAITLSSENLTIAGQNFPREQLGRIVVVGAGKAGAGMVAGFEAAIPEGFLKEYVTGWVNVPADCVPTDDFFDGQKKRAGQIYLHPARPAGINEPTPEAAQGAEEILRLVSTLKPNDLCLVLLSGGGSALLPAPQTGITLSDKLYVTQKLAKAGASIEEMNLVRSSLSKIKAGGLLKACTSKKIVTLIISDVIGDPLATIASGPTVFSEPNINQSLQTLQHYLLDDIPENVLRYLLRKKSTPVDLELGDEKISVVKNTILGSNAVAVDAASSCARELGYHVINLGSKQAGIAKEFGGKMIQQAVLQSEDLAFSDRPVCIIAGGETVVPISETMTPGKGGRNQEVALAAVLQMTKMKNSSFDITLLSAGTDGEDGPTDAAGAFADAETERSAQQLNLEITDSLNRHDSYHFFEACDSLLKTGPTHTNVMDLCVLLVQK